MALILRRLGPDDDLVELTALIHRAYAPLAAAGMRFWASHQPVSDTARRCAEGETWLAVEDGRFVGTVTLKGPERAGGAPFYDQPDVATVHQFSVEPDVQGRGVGARLLSQCETRAVELGAAVLALDTSEHALDLISWYERRGYRRAGRVDWRPEVNYRSLILAKALPSSPIEL